MAYQYGNKYGEYIHLHYDNYLKYGLARKNSKRADHYQSLSFFVEQQKKKIQQSLANQNIKTELAELSKILNFLTRKSSEPPNLTAAEMKKIQEGTFQSLQKIFTNLSEDDLDWEHLTIKPTAVKRLISGVDLNKIGNLGLSTETLKYSSLGKSGQINVSNFIKQIQAIRKLLQSIASDSNLNVQELRSKLRVVVSSVNQLKTKSKKRIDLSSNSSLITEFRQIARDILKAKSVSMFNGQFLEIVVGESLGTLLQLNQQETANLLTGAIPGKVQYLEEQFDKNLDIGKILGKNYQKITDSENIVSWQLNRNSQGKLDIYGTIDDTPLGASLKNYNLLSKNPKLQDVHLVKGSNILYMMQSQIPFLNHYLNQTVISKSYKGYDVGPPRSGITVANHYMKRMLFLIALSGGGLRTDITSGKYASVFIINDNSENGGIGLYSTIDLFNTIIRYKNLSDQVNVSLNKNTTWNNIWAEGSSQQRITNLLHQIKSHKVDVQVGFATMRAAMNKTPKF